MNNITFSITYYGQIDRLQYQLDFFVGVDSKYRDHITLQLINDGYKVRVVSRNEGKLINLKDYPLVKVLL